MLSRRYRIVLVITLLFSLSLACSLTGNDGPVQEQSSEDAIATSVAATLTANEGDQAVADDPPAGTELHLCRGQLCLQPGPGG